MNYFKGLLLLISSLVLLSCGTKRIPEAAIHLHEDQLNLLNGYYEIVPYESYYSSNLKSLDQLFNMQIPLSVSYVELEFISNKVLKVSYEIGGFVEERIVKGKHKHGGFYLEKSWGALGFPPFFWAQWNQGQRIFMGNDDNLILDEFNDQNLLLFGFNVITSERETYLFDRLYKQIHTNPSKKNFMDK